MYLLTIPESDVAVSHWLLLDYKIFRGNFAVRPFFYTFYFHSSHYCKKIRSSIYNKVKIYMLLTYCYLVRSYVLFRFVIEL